MIRSAFQTVIAISCLFSGSAMGASAEDTVAAFLNVVGTADYETAASFYDPDDLRSFRESLGFIEDDDRLIKAIYEEFYGEGATLSTVRALSDAQFFAPYLRMFIDDEDMFKVELAKFKMIGSIREDDGLVHVLTRHTGWVDEEPFDTIVITQVIDTGNVPRIKIAPEVEVIPIIMRQY